MNERPSSQCTCDAVMGKEAKTHWIVPFFSVYIPFFVGFVFGFSQYLFLPSCLAPPPSRHYLFEICMERICFCHAYLTFIPFCRPAGVYLVRIDGWKAQKTFYHSLEEKFAVSKTRETNIFRSRTSLPGCLQARFWLLAGKWGLLTQREIVSNWLAKPLYENWTYTSSRGSSWIFLL